MTIASTISKARYAGNGSTMAFAVPFPFIADQDLELVLSGADGELVLSPGTDYQISGAGDAGGGTCTLSTPPAVGETLVIRRDPALVQEVDYVENDAFPASSHEAALDKLTMICQALAERLDRTITFRVSSAVSGVQLPDPDPGRVLGWNGDGNDLSNVELAALGAEPADTAILKAEEAALLQAVYGDDPQVHTGADLSGLTAARNHILWTLAADSQFSADATLPYTGTYVFHVYPAGNALAISTAYKSTGTLPDPDPAAGEVRIVVEYFNSRRTILSLQNMEA